MKVVINSCFGGFSLSSFAVEKLGLDFPYAYIERTNPMLISLIEMFGSEMCSGSCAELEVVTLPAEITDWMISEYDGLESVIYVVDGKLYTR